MNSTQLIKGEKCFAMAGSSKESQKAYGIANKINWFPFHGPCPITYSQHSNFSQLCHICHSSQSPPMASHHSQNERLPLFLCLISSYTLPALLCFSHFGLFLKFFYFAHFMLCFVCLECSSLKNSQNSLSHLSPILM